MAGSQFGGEEEGDGREVVSSTRRLLAVFLGEAEGDVEELYDEYNGLRCQFLERIGFYGNYLTKGSHKKNVARRWHAQVPRTWKTSASVFQDVKSFREAKILHWNFCEFARQERIMSGYRCHARGVFVCKTARVVVVYEPRRWSGQVNPSFGPSMDDFVVRFGALAKVLIYGNQGEGNDCEKRVVRFGLCCWNRVKEKCIRWEKVVFIRAIVVVWW